MLTQSFSIEKWGPLMTDPMGTVASGFTPSYGNPAFNCGGARVRAQYRHLATVVTVGGALHAENIDRVSTYSRRFILTDTPFVLDLSGVDSFGAQAIPFLHGVDEDCRAAGVEWALIASPAVTQALRIVNDEAGFPVAGSVHAALHRFADAIATRRRLLLPLLTKTA